MTTIRLALAALVAMASGLIVAAPASAAPYYAPPAISVGVDSAQPGQTFAVSYAGAERCTELQSTFRGQKAFGTSVQFTAPKKAGTYTGTGKCTYEAGTNAKGKTLYGKSTVQFTVDVAGATTSPVALPSWLQFFLNLLQGFFGFLGSIFV